jgi:hypothetical protein
MPRYVILAHDWPTPHFDLLLEAGGVFKSWRLLARPTPGTTVPATPNADHRLHYLDYEGPVGGDRGTVTRYASGEYEGEITSATWALRWDVGWATMTAAGFTAPPQAR